jgi:hypothetical protein
MPDRRREMNGNMEHLNQIIVGLADLIREVRLHGRTARFDSRAPGLLEEAMQALKQGAAAVERPVALRQGMGEAV